ARGTPLSDHQRTDANRWWLDDPHERYWVETLSERRLTLGHQLHAPQLDGSGRPSWRYSFVAETRPGDVVLHGLHSREEHGLVGWSGVDGRAEPRPIEWQARGTYGRQRPDSSEERPGWWVPLRDFKVLEEPIGLVTLNTKRLEIAHAHSELADRYGLPLYLALTLYQGQRGVQVGQGFLFKWPAALNDVFDDLRAVRQFTLGEP